MKSMISYFLYFVCAVLLCSCGGNANRTKGKATPETVAAASSENKVNYVNSLKITSPEKNEVYKFGDQIVIHFDTKDRFPLDSSIIYLNGLVVAKLGKDEKSYTWKVPEGKVGNTTLKIIGWHPGNKQGVVSVTLEIKPDQAPRKYDYKVVKVYPHDPRAYTQGLLYQDGYMYESTGQYGESSIRKIDMNTGKVLSVLNIDSQLFGEGITIYKDKIYQITWRSRKGFVYDLKTFSLESGFHYNSEGWGITTAGDHLIMSDGSNKLYHIAPSTFNIMKEVEVYDHNGEVTQLNELEYIDGLVWANVWLTDRIVAIDPETGVVKAEIDMTGLLSPTDKARTNDKDDVLNGIAWNPEKKTFYLTGKRWPKLFEIKLQTPETPLSKD